jgi:radical SAM superfamily enzyme YgiQ (UPF0313 family)
MKIAVVLMPWYRRESPSPDVAMTISILKKQNYEILLWDINSLIFNDTFTLRKYWKYFLLDASNEVLDNFYNHAKEFFEYYSDKIISSGADVIIFKCIGKTYENSVRLAKIIKNKDKNKIIIFCGILVCSETDVECFINSQYDIPADFIICGEDEIALTNLITLIERNEIKKADIVFNKIGKVINCIHGPYVEDINILPFFDFSDFNFEFYRFPQKIELFMSKGCPWRCTFCIDWMVESKYRYMSGRRIYEEMLYQSKLYPYINHFRFCDKTINGDIRSLEQLCDLVIQGIKQNEFRKEITWSGDAMIRSEMTKTLLKKMSEANCVGLGYGLESGSDKVISDMGKRFSISVAEEVIKNTHLCGIKTSINIMVGFPTETRKDFEETLNFIKRNKMFIDEIRLTYAGCRVYHNSYLYRNSNKYHIVYNHPDYWSTKDGLNNYEERIKRTEEVCNLVLSLGLELRLNSRVKRKINIENERVQR